MRPNAGYSACICSVIARRIALRKSCGDSGSETCGGKAAASAALGSLMPGKIFLRADFLQRCQQSNEPRCLRLKTVDRAVHDECEVVQQLWERSVAQCVNAGCGGQFFDVVEHLLQ